jgi:hypothetical protein
MKKPVNNGGLFIFSSPEYISLAVTSICSKLKYYFFAPPSPCGRVFEYAPIEGKGGF